MFPVVAVYGLSGCIRVRKPSKEPITRLARVSGARTVHDQNGQRRHPCTHAIDSCKVKPQSTERK